MTRGRGRPSHGLDKQIHVRAQEDESQMGHDIQAQLGLSSVNLAHRWAIRFAWQHATSTDDHSKCPPNSPCASATRALIPGRQRKAAAADDQLTITHAATMEEPK